MKIIIDIGGTHFRVARVNEARNGFYYIEKGLMVEDYNLSLNNIFGSIDRIIKRANLSIEKIVIGFPGNFNTDYVITRAPNLKQWVNKNIKEIFSKYSSNILLNNDANLAGLGEANFGAGKGFEKLTYITVSTGLGGSLIIGGKVHESDHFEPGAQILDDESGRPIEDLVSGAGILKNEKVDPKKIFDSSFWNKKSEILAKGLIKIINKWQPDALILGGPMIKGKPAMDFNMIKNFIEENGNFFEANNFKLNQPIALNRISKIEILISILDEPGLYGGLIFC